MGAYCSKTLDDFVAPFSSRISQDVAGNMTVSLLSKFSKEYFLDIISEIKATFEMEAASILKDNLLSFLVFKLKSYNRGWIILHFRI